MIIPELFKPLQRFSSIQIICWHFSKNDASRNSRFWVTELIYWVFFIHHERQLTSRRRSGIAEKRERRIKIGWKHSTGTQRWGVGTELSRWVRPKVSCTGTTNTNPRWENNSDTLGDFLGTLSLLRPLQLEGSTAEGVRGRLSYSSSTAPPSLGTVPKMAGGSAARKKRGAPENWRKKEDPRFFSSSVHGTSASVLGESWEKGRVRFFCVRVLLPSFFGSFSLSVSPFLRGFCVPWRPSGVDRRFYGKRDHKPVAGSPMERNRISVRKKGCNDSFETAGESMSNPIHGDRWAVWFTWLRGGLLCHDPHNERANVERVIRLGIQTK